MEKDTTNLIVVGSVGIISAIIGSILTILANEFKSWRDARKDRKKILSTALYNQMELYGEVIRLDPKVHAMMQGKLTDLFAELGATPDQIKALPDAGPFFAILMGQLTREDIQDIGKRYEDITERVAEVDPLLAGRISLRFTISRSLRTDGYLAQLADANTNDPNALQFLTSLRLSQFQKHNSAFVESIEESIRETARQIGKDTEKEIDTYLENGKKDFYDMNSPEMNEYIETIKASMMPGLGLQPDENV